jgi:predicted enzyme related to lactoylglutathione lyase
MNKVEIGFQVPNVEPAWHDWHAKGIPMLTVPAQTPFGRLFEARDPDGYRLNVYELSGPA